MMQGYYMQITTKQWVWGPSAHWRLYYSLRRFSKRWIVSVTAGLSSTDVEEGKDNNVADSWNKSHARPCPLPKQRKFKRHEFRRKNSTSFANSAYHGEKNITNEEINKAIWNNENSVDIISNNVFKCETNQLSSNNPNEDQLFVTQSALKDGLLFGVLDGHGGSTFGEYTKKRLPCYLHTSLCDKISFLQNNMAPLQLTENILERDNTVTDENLPWVNNLDCYMKELTDKVDLNNHFGSILSYVSNPLRQLFGSSITGEDHTKSYDMGISQAIRDAFLKFDEDMTTEIKYMAAMNQLNSQNIEIALSGCCALIAYFVKNELFVANLGDCRAVLGSNNNGNWSAVQLTQDQTAVANPDEVQRILSEHPSSETRSCIQYGRLLGRLAPLRALGDIQFKLTPGELCDIFKILPKYSPFQGLKTPPYLTAEPEVFHYKLEKDDRFVVLASDGLWDMLSNDEVVDLVAAYVEGNRNDKLKEQARLYSVPGCDEIISNPNAFTDSENENVASFLIRFALGGYDKNSLSSMLTIPYPDVRLYRDDISVTVIFLENKEDDSSPDIISI